MSYGSGLSELPPWYPPMAGHQRKTRLKRNRPLSDSDIWAAYLPALPHFACRSITDHSCLKVYNKDPAQAFSHGPRPANGDARVSAPHTCTRSRRTKSNLRVPHSHILFAGRNEGMSWGSFIVLSGDPPCGLRFGLKRGQTNLNCRAIFLRFSPLGIVPNLLLFLFHFFFSPCKCDQTKLLAEPFPQALLPKSTSLILLTLCRTRPHHLHWLQVFLFFFFATTTLSYDRNCINPSRHT